MKYSKLRAFTLIEMVGIVVILSILVAGFAFTVGTTVPTTPPRLAADALAEVFKSAQRRAVAEDTIVAVVFPTDAGNSGLFQSYYLLEGMLHPEFVIGRDLSSEQERVYWTTAFDRDFAGLTLDEPRPNSLGVSLDDWDPPYPQDHHFIFLPSGEITSNGMPLYGDHYRVVVADGLEVEPAAAPPGTSPAPSWTPSWFRLFSRSPCASVVLTPQGTIGVVDQLPGGSVPLGQDFPDPQVSSLPNRPTGLTSSITLADPSVPVLVSPDPREIGDFLSPPAVEALVAENRHLKLSVAVESTRGFPLFCNWSAEVLDRGPTPYTSNDAGEYSSPGNGKMTWNYEEKRWESQWSWAPPPGSANATFRLECDVRDSEGTQLTAPLDAMVINAGVSNDPVRIGFVSAAGTNPRINRAYTARGDGTDRRLLDSSSNAASWVAISPDGRWVALELDLGGSLKKLAIVNANGSDRIDIDQGPNHHDWYPVWGPTSNYLIFHRMVNGVGPVEILSASFSDLNTSTRTITPNTLIPVVAGAHGVQAHVSRTPIGGGNPNHRLVWVMAGGPFSGGLGITEITPQGRLALGVTPSLLVDWQPRACGWPFFRPDDANLLTFLSDQTEPGSPAWNHYEVNLGPIVAETPLSPTQIALARGRTHVGRLNGNVTSAGFGKWDTVGDFHFISSTGALYRAPFSGPLPHAPQMRLPGGVQGHLVTGNGDIYANVLNGGAEDILLLRAGEGSPRRLTNNTYHDKLISAIERPATP